MNADDLKRYVADRRAVEQRELDELAAAPLDARTSFRFALDLLLFDEAMNGCPFNRHDPVEEQEVEKVRETWHRLRKAWGSVQKKELGSSTESSTRS